MKFQFVKLSVLAGFCVLSLSLKSQPNFKDALFDSTETLFNVKEQFIDWANSLGDMDSAAQKVAKRFSRFERFWDIRVQSPDAEKNGKFSNWGNTYSSYWANPQCTGTDEANWKALGPFPVSSYFTMGFVGAVWNDPNDQNFILAGGARRGTIWRSSNGGQAWECVTDPQRLPISGVTSFAVSPNKINNKRVIYATTGDESYSIGILKSIDDGDTWTQISSFPPLLWNTQYYELRKVVLPQNISVGQPDIIYTGANNTFFASTDGGVNWSSYTFANSGPIYDIEVFPNNYNKIAISTKGIKQYNYTTNQFDVIKRAEVWLSTDGGNTWQEIMQNLNTSYENIITNIFLDIVNSSEIYSHIITTDYGTKKIAKTTDDGISWNVISNATTGLYGNCFDISETTGDKYEGGALFYKNSIVQFPYSATANTHCDIRALQIIENPPAGSDIIILGTDGGITKSYDGGNTWHSLNGIGENGLVNNEVHGFDITEKDEQRIIVGLQDNHAKLMLQNNWSFYFGGGDGEKCLFDPSDHDIFYIMFNCEIYKYKIVNNSLQSLGSVTDPGNNCYYYSIADKSLGRPMAIDHQNPNIIYTGLKGGKINKTNNGGQPGSWQTIQIPGATSEVIDIEIAPSNSNIVYVALNHVTWGSTPEKAIYRSDDQGLTWTDITGSASPIQNTYAPITDITVDWGNPNRVWVTMGGVWHSNGQSQNRVFRTDDASQGMSTSWANMTLNLSALPVTAILHQPGTDSRVFIGTDAGIFYYSQPDNEWKCFSNGFPIAFIKQLKINRKTKEIYASTYGRGIWKSPLPCLDDQQSVVISSGTNPVWDRDKMCGDILIESNATLTINNQAIVSMGEPYFITIEPGAKLIVDNATITSGCNDAFWGGIQVWGQRYLSQMNEADQGVVILKNDAVIENASTAIQAIEGDMFSSSSHPHLVGTGGIIVADNASFINNKRSIWAGEYENFDPNRAWFKLPNRSYIKNCLFKIDENYIDGGGDFSWFIRLKNANGIRIYGNDFINSTSIDGFTQRGTGISCYGASFNARYSCPSSWHYLWPCPEYKKNHFEGLNYGIAVLNNNTCKPITIDMCEFVNNYRGVLLTGCSNARVTGNEFLVPNVDPGYEPAGSYYSEADKEPYGLYLNGNPRFYVEENNFQSLEGEDGKAESTNGLIVNNAFDNNNELYKNNFSNLQWAFTALNTNRGALEDDPGLKLFCNNFTDYSAVNYNDVDVTYTPPEPLVTGIAKHQRGNIIVNGTPYDIPAENIFSHDCYKPDADFDNDYAWHLDYYHNTGNAAAGDHWVPKCYSNILPISLYTDPEVELCESKADDFTRDIREHYDNLAIAAQALKSARIVLKIWEDGGIPDLEEQVGLTEPWEAYDQFNALMLESPYLSEEVLIEFILNPVFTELMVKLLCVANPQSSRSEPVIEALYGRVPPMPQSYIDEILAEEQTISQLELLQGDVAACHHHYKQIAGHIIINYLNDTIDEGDYVLDSLVTFLTREEDLNAKYELASVYFNNEMYDEMDNLLQEIPNMYELQENQPEIHEQYVDYYAIMREMKENGLKVDELSAEQQQQLVEIAIANNHYCSHWALSLLRQREEGYDYTEPIIHSETGGFRKSRRVNKVEKQPALKIYPNPALDYTTLEYRTGGLYQDVWIEMHDMTGRVLFNKKLQGGDSEELLDLRTIKPGIYLIKLMGDNKLIESTVISIVSK